MLVTFGNKIRFAALAAALAAAVTAAPALAADPQSDARAMVTGMAEAVIGTLRAGADKAAREARFREMYRRNFDNAGIAAWAAGRAFQSASPAAKQDYLATFESYIVKAYAAQLTKYKGERLRVDKVETEGRYTVVISNLVPPDPRDPREIEMRLENGELQVGLGFVPISNLSIESEPLFEERLVLIVRDDHPLADQSPIPVQSLDRMPMVMLSNTFCTRRLWEENAQLASAQPQIVMEMNTVSSILAVVEKTGLATVLPKLTVAEKRFDHLVGLDLHNPTPSRQVGLLWHRENYLCSASRAFIAITKQVSAAFH